MKQVAGLIPTYSSDEFGICSALYELGGMVVMHDASGCNSTYTTHDEPRWYDMDSMIFISAISEMEAIMGDDEKFIGDLIETANELHPKFIAIVGAPIPYMIGTDFRAIASIVEEETGIPCLGFEANGMHDYTRGVSWALKAVVEHFCEDQCSGNRASNSMVAASESICDCEADKEKVKISEADKNRVKISEADKENVIIPGADKMKTTVSEVEKTSSATKNMKKNKRVNIIGATPLDFSLNGSVDSIKTWLSDNDFEVNCCMAMGSSLEEISRAGQADVNLVISATGIAAAEELKKRFGQPYLVGVPVKAPVVEGNADRKVWFSGAGETSEVKKVADAWEIHKDDKVLIIGEAVYGSSLAQTIDCAEVTIACPLEHHQGITEENLETKEEPCEDSSFFHKDTENLMRSPKIVYTPEEDDIMAVIVDADVVIADPFYKVLVNNVEARIRFIDLPHEAFSGRIYDAVNPNLIRESTFSQELIRRLREIK